MWAVELSEEEPQMLGQRDRPLTAVVAAYLLRQSKYLVSSTTQMLIENIQYWLHQPHGSLVLFGLGDELVVTVGKPG